MTPPQETQPTINPNSAIHWLPAARAATEYGDVNTPATQFVDLDFMESLSILDGDPNPDGIPWGDLDRAACDLGWPVFIRSDLTSAKHSGLDAVRATDADDVKPVVETIVRDCVHKSMQPAAFLVREWVDIEHAFTAFDGLPIGTEFRVFAGPDDILCHHYYWPADAIRDANVPDETWRAAREELADVSLPPAVRVAATSAASRANRHDALDPLEVWSIDFARDADGQWWLIDMALAAESWHPVDCQWAEVEA